MYRFSKALIGLPAAVTLALAAFDLEAIERPALDLVLALREARKEVPRVEYVERRLRTLEEELGQSLAAQAALDAHVQHAAAVRVFHDQPFPSFAVDQRVDAAKH